MPSYMTPGLYFETVDTARTDIVPTRVDIPAFIGIANQGPLHQPTQINSQAQFQAIFGGFIPNSYLAYTVKAFFENGGTRCYVVRVAADTFANAKVDLLDENGQPTLHITASSPGSWGNDLVLFLTRSSTFSTRTNLNAPRPDKKDVLFVQSIVGFPVGTLVKIFQPQPSMPKYVPAYRIVTKSDSSQSMLTLDAALDDFYDLSKPIYLETVEFSLTVYLAGQIREIFSQLSLVPDSEHYVENAITEASSQLIRVKDLHSPTPLPGRLPDPAKIKGSVKLQGGKDGLAALQPEDLIGDPTSDVKRGLRTLEDVPDVASVAAPDLTLQPIPVAQPLPSSGPPPNPCLPAQGPLPVAGPPGVQAAEQPPGFSSDQVFQVQQAMIDFCELQKRCIAILDPPVQPSGTVLNVAEIQAWRRRFDSKYVALYYPQLLVYDPLKLGGQVVRAIPPCGHVAGMYARVDGETGPYRAPANEELSWVQAVSVEINAAVQGVLNPLGINCIRTFPGRGVRIYGARTLSSDASWTYVNVRRLFLMLERSIEVATQWVVFEPNDTKLRHTLVLTITAFLEKLWKQGAFAGSKPTDAFFVKINDKLATGEGQLIVDVGVAPSIPAEFVVFRIGRTLDELEITEK